MAYLSVPKISRHLMFLHLSSPFIVDNCPHISNLSFAITYLFFKKCHDHSKYILKLLKLKNCRYASVNTYTSCNLDQ